MRIRVDRAGVPRDVEIIASTFQPAHGRDASGRDIEVRTLFDQRTLAFLLAGRFPVSETRDERIYELPLTWVLP